MIYCKLDRLGRYYGLGENLDTAIRYLETHDLAALPMGKTAIDGEAVYINRFDYETVAHNIAEAHLNDIDIHVVLEGEERVGVADISELRTAERNEDGDLIDSEIPFSSLCKLCSNDVLIVFPEDAHAPKLLCGSSSMVKKAVIKVRDKQPKE